MSSPIEVNEKKIQNVLTDSMQYLFPKWGIHINNDKDGQID